MVEAFSEQGSQTELGQRWLSLKFSDTNLALCSFEGWLSLLVYTFNWVTIITINHFN